ncbi:AAA family ATPase [Halogranum amylolyticum]|nr:AAA family ATPase [Halogranum amylolyticum]
MARVIAVASAKGGVGKTTTTVALGTTLAAAGYDVVAVDTDLGMANLGATLGVDADGATVHDVLAGRADVGAATYEGPAGLSVVPGDTDLAAFPDADPAKLRTVLEAFADADYVLLDTGAGLSHDTVLPLGLADDVLLVTDTTPNAVGDTEKTRQVVDRLDGSVVGLVVTQVDADVPDDDLPIDGVDAPLLATVPTSPVVAEATATGDALVESDPADPAAAAYRRLARAVTDEPVSDPDVESTETTDADAGDDSTVDARDAVDDAETAADDDAEASTDDDATESDPEEVGETAAVAGAVDPVETDESEGDSNVEAVPLADESDAADDEETLVPDAEDEGESSTADGGTDASDDDVYTTPLVDEAEVSGVSAAESPASTDEESAESTVEAESDEAAADEEGSDEDEGDDDRSGFLGRLLG